MKDRRFWKRMAVPSLLVAFVFVVVLAVEQVAPAHVPGERSGPVVVVDPGHGGADGGADGGKNDAHKDASSDPSAGLDALDKLKSQINCPVDLKSLAGSM